MSDIIRKYMGQRDFKQSYIPPEYQQGGGWQASQMTPMNAIDRDVLEMRARLQKHYGNNQMSPSGTAAPAPQSDMPPLVPIRPQDAMQVPQQESPQQAPQAPSVWPPPPAGSDRNPAPLPTDEEEPRWRGPYFRKPGTYKQVT